MFKSLVHRVSSRFEAGSFRKYVFNTGWLIGEKVLKIVAGVFVGAYVARYLGPYRFGILNYADSFVALFWAFSTLGMDSILVRELVRSPEKRDALLGTTLVLRGFSSLVMLGLIGGILQVTESDAVVRVSVLIIAFGYLFRAFRCLEGYFQAQTQTQYILISSVVQLTVSSVLKVYLVWTRASLLSFVVVMMLEGLLLAGGLIFCYARKRLSVLRWSFRKDTAVALLRDSWPMILSMVAVMLNLKIDQVMINNSLGAAEVGIYAAAVRISELWYFIAIVVCDSLFPAILRAKEKDHGLYWTRLAQLFRLLFWTAVPLMAVIGLFAGPIIRILFGPEYSGAAAVLRVHVWGVVFVYMGTVIGRYLIAQNETKIVLLRNVSGALVNIALNYIFISKYGIVGAAWATLLSYVVVIFVIGLVPRMRGIIGLMLRSLFFK